MNENQKLLVDIGVSIERLNDMISYAISAGAYGAKLSGAGGGDCMIALVSDEKRKAVEKAIEKLSKRHQEHIAVYGHGLEDRLTGKHETADIKTFLSGVGHRGASIRIPLGVANDGYGYLEDRRPGANADPYEIAAALVKTICLESVTEKV